MEPERPQHSAFASEPSSRHAPWQAVERYSAKRPKPGPRRTTASLPARLSQQTLKMAFLPAVHFREANLRPYL